MKRGSTLFLKIVVFAIGLAVLAWLLYFPQIEGRNRNSDPISLYFNDPFLAYVYLSMTPFFFGIYQVIKLLGYIEQNKVFTEVSVKALKTIKYCGVIFAGFVLGAMPMIFSFAQEDDAPGVVPIGLVFILVSLAISTAAGVAQRLLQSAIDFKSENDLTV